MEEYQKRVIGEKYLLDSKIIKLSNFIHQATFVSLSKQEQKLLIKQREIMIQYSNILKQRISAFTK
jgi:hypothetical protein